MKMLFLQRAQWQTIVGPMAVFFLLCTATTRSQTLPTSGYEFNDSHFHLTNNIQEGPDIGDFLRMMGKHGRTRHTIRRTSAARVAVRSRRRPRFDLLSALGRAAVLLLVDRRVDRQAYQSLPRPQRNRLDPMITGFNPADMYAADHMRRVLKTFPGVFSGIGEFTIHKELCREKFPGQ